MHILHLLCCLLLLLVESTISLKSVECPRLLPRGASLSIGIVIDENSRVGKEQKIAMELAAQDLSHCLNLALHIKDLHGNSTLAASAALDLINHKHVDTIVGVLTLEAAEILTHLLKTPSPPILSLSPPPPSPPPPPTHFLHVNPPSAYQIHCAAAIVAHFRWRKLILIHELGGGAAASLLQSADSSIEIHAAVDRSLIETDLKKLRSNGVRVFVVLQSSAEFAAILFEKARDLGMMESGYVWIVADEISNLLDSLDPSILLNMQGALAIKTDLGDLGENKNFRAFKSRFRRKFASEYPSEEETNPSIYALRAYAAISFVAGAGEIGFLSEKPSFQIVNVIGRSYRELALWSPESGFSGGDLASIYWPGGDRAVPRGWSLGSKETPLRIGVPAKGAFKQFVKVTHDSGRNTTRITGFSIEVFEAAVEQLPYDLHYVLVPYYGSYDEMVAQVHNKSLDAAVGDTEIMADRYVYAEFSQPYIESGLVMVVTVKPGLQDSKFIALNPFTRKMWLQLAAVSTATGAVVWLSEFAAGNEQFARNSAVEIVCSILWLSVTIISFSQRENIKNPASKLVLAAWICVVFVVGASFTAVLSSMMTVPRLEPSVRDIDFLRNSNAAVGCNRDSFICRYLINVLNFGPQNVKSIDSIDAYPRAFDNGDIKAAFFVAPHAKVFLAKYCNGYIVSGPSFKLGGFGFVFQKRSPLAIDISEAILKVSQSGHVDTLEQNMLHRSNCTSRPQSSSLADDIRLGPGPFSGLFLILGCILGLAFAVAVARLVRMRCTSVHDVVQRVLMKKRSYVWASTVVRECSTRFGSTFFGEEGVEMNVVVRRVELEPDLVGVVDATSGEIR